MLNTIWALLLPCAVGTYNIILMMNFMKGLPEALSESAFIDGAGHFTHAAAHHSAPVQARHCDDFAVHYLAALERLVRRHAVYQKSGAASHCRTYLRSVRDCGFAAWATAMSIWRTLIANATADGSNGAKIFLALAPIMCVYPFLQKHFAKGLVRGSVKE